MKKNKNKGFIATSLIYSLFLVFLALLLAILSIYITTNRILSTYNKNVRDRLDLITYIPEIYAKDNECYVEVGADEYSILGSCFRTYNIVLDSNGTNYSCDFKDNEDAEVEINNLISDDNPYTVTCRVWNSEIDNRLINSATTLIYVTDETISQE